jgi:C4-dicarboxylate-specific signal transduction histidine kinase
LVGDLQRFANRQGRDRIRVDVRSHLRSTISLVGPTLADSSIEVRTRFDEDLPEVFADAGALDQVFLNLLKNAIEAIDDRSGSIEVVARSVRDTVVIEVRDDGPGLSVSNQEQLFAPFVTTKRAGRGSGLGLSISRRIISDHDGTIRFLPDRETGTVVEIVLPAADHEGESASEGARHASAPAPSQ